MSVRVPSSCPALCAVGRGALASLVGDAAAIASCAEGLACCAGGSSAPRAGGRTRPGVGGAATPDVDRSAPPNTNARSRAAGTGGAAALGAHARAEDVDGHAASLSAVVHALAARCCALLDGGSRQRRGRELANGVVATVLLPELFVVSGEADARCAAVCLSVCLPACH
jgi:hypothetical protein